MRNRLVLVADTNDAFVDILREELSSTAYVLLHAKDGRPDAVNWIPCCRRFSISHSGRGALYGLVLSGSTASRAFSRRFSR